MVAEATDFSGILDIDSSLNTSSARIALTEAILRRLTTQNGSLPDFPDYGYDITSFIGTSFNQASIEQSVTNQILLEEEVDDCTVNAQLLSDNITVQLDITVTDGDSPFDFTISVDDLNIEIIIGNQAFTL